MNNVKRLILFCILYMLCAIPIQSATLLYDAEIFIKTAQWGIPSAIFEWKADSLTKEKDVYSFTGSSPISFTGLSVGWLATNNDIRPEYFKVAIRTRGKDGNWTEWTYTQGDISPNDSPSSLFWNTLYITPSDTHTDFEINIQTPIEVSLNLVRISVADASNGLKVTGSINISIKDDLAITAVPSRPNIIPRSNWWGGLPVNELNSPRFIPQYQNITHAIIHHTVTDNNPSNPAQAVRDIWNYHANTLNWGDIGYNFLIDQYGNIYQGRYNPQLDTTDVLAYHAGTYNTNSIGIAFIGQFESTCFPSTPAPLGPCPWPGSPDSRALRSSEDLIAWRFAQRNLDPLSQATLFDKFIYRIAGHSNVVAKACPGDNLYSQLPTIRTNVKNLIEGANNTPPNAPYNISPANGATGISLTPTLIASVFSDPDSGDYHWKTWWDIKRVSDNAVMWDSGWRTFDLTSTVVPVSASLQNNTSYKWRVRYMDDKGTWSEPLPVATEFTTIAALQDTLNITSGPLGNPNPVDSGGQVNFSASATDSLNHTINWLWTAPTGSFSPNNSVQNPTWTAPANNGNTELSYTINVKATCSGGQQSSINYTQKIRPNDVVLFDYAPDGDPNPVNSGGQVQCSASVSDFLGHQITWLWTASGGSFNNQNIQNPVWTAPVNNGNADMSYDINAKATCSGGKSNNRSYTQKVMPEDKVIIASAPTGNPNPVGSGLTVNCSTTATDSIGHNISYSWTATPSGGSFANPNIQNPVWTAPANNGTSTVNYTLTVTATCTGGKTDTKSYQQGVLPTPDVVTITTLPTGTPNPVASSGTVNCSTAATDNKGHNISYAWTATPSGSSFANANIQNPVWTAPANTGTSTVNYTLTVTATCTGGKTDTKSYQQGVLQVPPTSDVVTISTLPSGNLNPVASGGTVNCSTTATDSKGHSISYSWTATGGSFANANVQNPVWTAPANNTGSIIYYTLTVIATCTGGKTDTKSYQQGVNLVAPSGGLWISLTAESLCVPPLTSVTCTLGGKSTAVDGFGPEDIPLPPVGMTPYLDASFLGTSPFERLGTDIRLYNGSTPFSKTWRLKVKTDNSSNCGFSLCWNILNGLPQSLKTYITQVSPTGGVSMFDMRNNACLPGQFVKGTEYVFDILVTSTISVNIPMSKGWNMISIPGEPLDPDVTDIVAGTPVLPLFYTYKNGGYVSTTTVKCGPGYWAAATEACVLTVYYIPCTSVDVPLNAGWSMVGSVSNAVLVGSLTSSPSNHLPVVYGYNGSGYVSVSSLAPGKGHWVAATALCTLTINCAPPSPPAPQAIAIQPTWESILIIQSQGQQQKLVFGSYPSASTGVDILMDRLLPPPLPDMSLDNGKVSNGILKYSWVTENPDFPLLSASYIGDRDPLVWHLSVELAKSGNLKLTGLPSIYSCTMIENGQSKEIHGSVDLSAGTHELTLVLRLVDTKPKKTHVLPNYPNPFNPETWIPYELSKDTRVEIKIYTPGGQLVRSMDLGHKLAGSYLNRTESAYWDGKNEAGEIVNSGVYFYTLMTPEFFQTRKLVVLR